MASHDALNWYVTFVSYVPESSAWLLLGILLVVCSTERVGPTDYVGYLLSLQVNGKATLRPNEGVPSEIVTAPITEQRTTIHRQ